MRPKPLRESRGDPEQIKLIQGKVSVPEAVSGVLSAPELLGRLCCAVYNADARDARGMLECRLEQKG